MANADRPTGFRPYGPLLRVTEYTAGAAIYPGDLVIMSDDGKIDPAATGGSTFTAAALGVALSYASADGEACAVADHPDQLYVVQADGTDIDDQTDIGLNYDVVGTDPDTTFGVSRMELDSSTGATTAATPLRLIKIDDRPDNALGAQVDCIVRINNHQQSVGTGSAGV